MTPHATTRRPQTLAGKALLALSARLLTFTSIEQAHQWEDLFSDYTTTFGPWLDERTFADDNPQHAAATGRK